MSLFFEEIEVPRRTTTTGGEQIVVRIVGVRAVKLELAVVSPRVEVNTVAIGSCQYPSVPPEFEVFASHSCILFGSSFDHVDTSPPDTDKNFPFFRILPARYFDP